MVAPTKIIAGLGMSLGIEVLEAEGATGDYRTLFHKKAEVIAQALTSGAGWGWGWGCGAVGRVAVAGCWLAGAGRE